MKKAAYMLRATHPWVWEGKGRRACVWVNMLVTTYMHAIQQNRYMARMGGQIGMFTAAARLPAAGQPARGEQRGA